MLKSVIGLSWLLHASSLPSAADQSVAARQEEERRGLFEAVAPGTVFITCGKALGSGFVAGAQGLLVTNAHVVSDCANDAVVVVFFDGQRRRARVVKRDPVFDLALLLVDHKSLTAPVLPLANSSAARVGDYVAVVSHPMGAIWTLNEGFISNIHTASEDAEASVIQTQAPLLPGSSGGAVVNRQGAVVCVHTAGLKSQAAMGFCIPSLLVARLMEEHGLERVGMLAVEGDVPGAAVFVDGSDRGALPLLVKLEPGPHKLSVRYHGRSVEKEFTVEGGTTFNFFAKQTQLKSTSPSY